MIDLQNVSVSFDNQRVLNGINFSMKQSEFVYLVGQTGMGKSTLMRLMYFDLLPSSGKVRILRPSTTAKYRASGDGLELYSKTLSC